MGEKRKHRGQIGQISHILHIKDSMCLLHIRLQLFTLTPIFFYYITHARLLQFSPPSIPDILCPSRASRGSVIHVFLVLLLICQPLFNYKKGCEKSICSIALIQGHLVASGTS